MIHNHSGYFELGVCELALGEYDDAAQSFEFARNAGHALAGGLLKVAVKELMADLECKSNEGDVKAIVRLAEVVGTGEFGLKKEFGKAVSLLRPHAERGELEAQKTLGGLLAEKTEFQDLPEATRWLKRAAEAGDRWAADFLNDMTAQSVSVRLGDVKNGIIEIPDEPPLEGID